MYSPALLFALLVHICHQTGKVSAKQLIRRTNYSTNLRSLLKVLAMHLLAYSPTVPRGFLDVVSTSLAVSRFISQGGQTSLHHALVMCDKQGPDRQNLAAGGKIHSFPFRVKSWLLPERIIRVWTPPSYYIEPERRYPVVYAHDGQWLMSDGWRSWGLQRTLSKLISQGAIEEPIVVMVNSVPSEQFGDLGPPILPIIRRRWIEYNLDLPGPGQRYLSFLCDELKPAIDKAFRTCSAPESTHALGSSMGGLCAFLSVWRRPDTFGNAACLSPVFQLPLVTEVALRGPPRFGMPRKPRIYIDNGGDTSSRQVDLIEGLNDGGYWWLDNQLQPGVDAMVNALKLHSKDVDLSVHREPGGLHTERAWGARSALPLSHLLRPA